MRSTVKQAIKYKRYNNEFQHTLSLNASTEKKRVKAQDKDFVDLSWCCDALHIDDKHMHSLDCDRQENMRKRDNLRLASVHAMNDSLVHKYIDGIM